MSKKRLLTTGVDGCRAGWIALTLDSKSGRIDAAVYRSARDLIAATGSSAVVAVDIPIGLPDSGQRDCDREARHLLGWPRRSSVFPTPIRPALRAADRLEASEITQRVDGRRVGVQSWAIASKIRDMDAALQENLTIQSRVKEVHPEVCFWALAGGRPMLHSKKRKLGRGEREGLVAREFGNLAIASVRAGFLRKEVADDDILDAFAALWTARRIANNQSSVLPAIPEQDSVGLLMEIRY